MPTGEEGVGGPAQEEGVGCGGAARSGKEEGPREKEGELKAHKHVFPFL